MDSIRLKNKYFDTTGIYDSAIGKTQNEVNYSKVDKVNGMGLSSNDYSFSEKEKVSNIKSMAYLDYVVTGEGYKFTENYWIRTESSVNVTAMESHPGFCCIAVPCVGGDKFTITGAGSTTTHRLWVFVKADGTFPTSNNAYCSGSNASEKNKVITAPSDAVYLVMNASMSNTDYPPSLYDGAVNQSVASSSLPTYSDIASSFTNGGLASGTYSFSFSVPRENISPVELNIESKYEGDSRPYIVVRLYNEAGTPPIFTGEGYNVGRTNQFIRQTFRIPNNERVRIINLRITVPESSTLYINNFNVNYNPCVKPYYCGIEVTAHEGYDKLYPHSSYRSIVAAADLGFNSCVVIPKFTLDNIPVCFHDDSGIGGDLRNEDGTKVSSLTSESKIENFTYDQLMQWNIGYTNSKNIYPEQKILLMDDFLRICAKTGMRPVFSIHPNPDTKKQQWGILKNLLDKYNLTEQLSIKSGNPDVWKDAITTFGDNKINSIIFLIGTDTTYTNNMSTVISDRRKVSGATNTKIVVEFYGYRVLGKGKEQDIQDQPRILEMVQEVKNAGCEVSIILDDETTEEMEYFLDIGVTKFMVNKHSFCSNGLNW